MKGRRGAAERPKGALLEWPAVALNKKRSSIGTAGELQPEGLKGTPGRAEGHSGSRENIIVLMVSTNHSLVLPSIQVFIYLCNKCSTE